MNLTDYRAHFAALGPEALAKWEKTVARHTSNPDKLTPAEVDALVLIADGRASVTNGRKTECTVTHHTFRRLLAAELVAQNGTTVTITDPGARALWAHFLKA